MAAVFVAVLKRAQIKYRREKQSNTRTHGINEMRARNGRVGRARRVALLSLMPAALSPVHTSIRKQSTFGSVWQPAP